MNFCYVTSIYYKLEKSQKSSKINDGLYRGEQGMFSTMVRCTSSLLQTWEQKIQTGKGSILLLMPRWSPGSPRSELHNATNWWFSSALRDTTKSRELNCATNSCVNAAAQVRRKTTITTQHHKHRQATRIRGARWCCAMWWTVHATRKLRFVRFWSLFSACNHQVTVPRAKACSTVSSPVPSPSCSTTWLPLSSTNGTSLAIPPPTPSQLTRNRYPKILLRHPALSVFVCLSVSLCVCVAS